MIAAKPTSCFATKTVCGRPKSVEITVFETMRRPAIYNIAIRLRLADNTCRLAASKQALANVSMTPVMSAAAVK